MLRKVTAARLLGEVLARAREMVGRSPEQVGDQTGVHGRTIRRLEDGDSQRPRRTTLQALAGYYGLDADFLTCLARWSAEGAEDETLRRLVTEEARAEIGDAAIAELDEQEEGDLLFAIAMRLARRRGAGTPSVRAPVAGAIQVGPEEEEIDSLVQVLASLDRRRRRVAAELLFELRRGQVAEQAVRRRDRGSVGPSDALAGSSPTPSLSDGPSVSS
jgi:transcriptional regulator with XRE-family HTH domain